MPLEPDRPHNVADIWNALFKEVALENANLSANLFFAYDDAFEKFDPLSRIYVSDERREWTELHLLPTDESQYFVMRFSCDTRSPVNFLIERVGRPESVSVFRAYSSVPGPLRKSTIESFVRWASGFWTPRLSYSFMDDLSGLLKEAYPDSEIDISEFVANVFERDDEGAITKQKTTRTWVEEEGDREYDLYRKSNVDIGRIVTLSGARFDITFPDNRDKMDFRIDHESRALLYTSHFEELKLVLNLLYEETSKEFNKYLLRKHLHSMEGQSDTGETVNFVEYAGTQVLTVTVETDDTGWFESLRLVLGDTKHLVERENMVPFVLIDEGNPLIQAQLVDLEGQRTHTLTVNKDDNRITIAPEDMESHVGSIGKIINFLEKTIGAKSIIV